MARHRARIGYTSVAYVTEIFPKVFYEMVPDGVTLALLTQQVQSHSADEMSRIHEAARQAAKSFARAGADMVILGGAPTNLARGRGSLDDGLEPVGNKSAGATFEDYNRIPADRALALGRELKQEHPEADTLLYGCPHWAVVHAIEPLERELGVNVVASLQAIVWEGLRKCGIDDRIDGYGRLLREH